MNWVGSGFITIINYAEGASVVSPDNAFLLMDNTDFMLMDGSDLLLTGS